MTIQMAIDFFIQDRESFCAPATVDYYKDRLKSFQIWCASEQIYDYEQLDNLVMQQYLLFLRSRKIKSTSCHNYFRAIYTMLHFFEDEYGMQHIKKIKLPKMDPDLIMPLSQEEALQLFDAVDRYSDRHLRTRDQLIIHLMIDCGLRSSEVRNLKKTDITSGSILIQMSKNNKSRVLPLPDKIKDLIRQLPEHGSSFLLADETGNQLSKNALKLFFRRLKEDSGVLRVHAHLLRHTFATSYMYYYGNLEYLRIYMGHASYDITQQYINISSQCLLTDFKIYKIPDCYK